MTTATAQSPPTGGVVRLAGTPLIGHLADYRRDPLELVQRCAGVQGSVVELKIRTRSYVLKDAEDVRHVIVSNADAYEKDARLVGARGGRVGTKGMAFRPIGAEHGRARGLVRPPMGREGVPRMDGEIVASADRAIESWGDGETIDVHREATALTFRAMLKALFGALPEDSPALTDGILTQRHYLRRTVRSLLPRPRFVPVVLSPTRRRALASFDRALHGIVARERSGNGRPTSLLAQLARGTGSEEEIRNQLLAIGVAGYTNVAAVLTWTLYELALNPTVAARLEAEVEDVVGGRAPVAADVERLPYTGMVISESLRLYPSAWVFFRTARVDDELPSGATLRAGAKVLLSPYLVHRIPAYYDEPERFDPGRMAPEKVAERPRFAYFPFGGGRRICIGRDFTLLQLTLVVARLAQRARLELLSGDATIKAGLDLRPREPIEMRVTKR